MLTRLGGTRHTIMPNLFKTGLSKAEIFQFFNFPNGRRRHLLFLKSPNFLDNRVQTIKTHVKFWHNRSISYVDIKILQFCKVADAAILNFQTCEISLADRVWKAQTQDRAKCRQNRSYCCGDIAIFRIFKMAAAIFDFLKLWNFICYWGGEGRDASPCQTSSKSVNQLRRY